MIVTLTGFLKMLGKFVEMSILICDGVAESIKSVPTYFSNSFPQGPALNCVGLVSLHFQALSSRSSWCGSGGSRVRQDLRSVVVVLFWPFLVSSHLDLQEAVDAAARGDYGDLDAAEILLEYAPLSQPPYLLAGAGLAIGILCGLTFSRLVSERLDAWKQDRLPLLPLGRVQTILPWMGLILGVTLFIGGSLQVFGFASGAALLLSFLLSLATGGAIWVQLVRLMQQVQDGNFKAVDFDNFDEFF